ncbi:hypothetical protein [Paenibacillus sp. 1P07SE]|uniref:hypothetical protein n=1 Tax=Paenibacillus sp. 1P07SE TaxID=3132209 RepID=UPI0039A743F3
MQASRRFIVGIAMLGLSVGLAGYDASPSQAAAPESLVHAVHIASPVEDHPRQEEQEGERHEHRTRRPHHDWGLQGAAHHEMYLKLLVDKYAPNTAKAWEPVLKEATQLRTELHQAISGLSPEARQKWKEARKTKQPSNWQAQRTKVREVHRAFDAAIASKDQVRISAALNEMLRMTREQNKWMAGKLAELRQEGASATSS